MTARLLEKGNARLQWENEAFRALWAKSAEDLMGDHNAEVMSDWLSDDYEVVCSCGFTAQGLASMDEALAALERHRNGPREGVGGEPWLR